MAFNAKNLHYEKQEPAFLRRLRGQHRGDRHEVQIARPKKDRLKTADEDDGPTIVGEDGADVTKEEYEAIVEGRDLKGSDENGVMKAEVGKVGEVSKEGKEEEAEAEMAKQKVAEIGGPRKRKAVKVVSEDLEDIDAVRSTTRTTEAGKAISKPGEVASKEKTDGGLLSNPAKQKKAKKKVKLSFDEEEAE